jgi:hypothetical protein
MLSSYKPQIDGITERTASGGQATFTTTRTVQMKEIEFENRSALALSVLNIQGRCSCTVAVSMRCIHSVHFRMEQ